MIPPHIPTTLSTFQTASIMGVSRPTLMKMIKEDKLDYIKVGNRYRINYLSIPSFIRKMYEEKQGF
jgi:excisionase family DNA binding protein